MTADGAWSTHFMTEQTMTTDLQTTMTDLHELTDAMQRLILDALLQVREAIGSAGRITLTAASTCS